MNDLYKEIKSEIKTGTFFFVLIMILNGIKQLFDMASEKLGNLLFGPIERKSGEPLQGLFPKAGQRLKEIFSIPDSSPSADEGYADSRQEQGVYEPIDFEVLKRVALKLTILNEMYSQNWSAMSPEEQVEFIMNAQASAEKNALEVIEKAGIDKKVPEASIN